MTFRTEHDLSSRIPFFIRAVYVLDIVIKLLALGAICGIFAIAVQMRERLDGLQYGTIVRQNHLLPLQYQLVDDLGETLGSRNNSWQNSGR